MKARLVLHSVRGRARALLLFGAMACAVSLGSCADPVHDTLVNSLGGEIGGVPQGEYHRAGQPCGACHGELGPAKTIFTMSGTIYYGPTKAIGVDNVAITMVDALDTSFTAYTNCVGNFFVTGDQWTPSFPVLVKIAKNADGATMQSHIGRETSCSNCHKDPPYYDSQGHIHLVNQQVESANQYTPPQCPVNPVQTGVGGGQ